MQTAIVSIDEDLVLELTPTSGGNPVRVQLSRAAAQRIGRAVLIYSGTEPPSAYGLPSCCEFAVKGLPSLATPARQPTTKLRSGVLKVGVK